MEAIIGKIAAHPDAKTVPGLLDLCNTAKGLRERTDMPGFEKRKRCLALFEATIGSGKPKLAHIGIEGFQLLIRDAAFISDADASKDDQRTIVQALGSLASLPSWDRQVQCQAVTIIVQAVSNTEVKVTLSDLYAAIQLCANVYKASEDQSVKLAVRAALTQLLNSFCINRYSNVAPESQEEIVVFMDMTALIKELLTRIDMGQQTAADELQLGFDALYSTLSVQPAHFYRHQPLLNVFTTELIPSLLCLLQFAGEKPEKAKSFLERARSTTKSQRATIFLTADMARSFYQLIEYVLKLMAPLEVSRSLTIELFRSAMVVPPPEKRYEPLRLLKRFTTTPTLLSSLLTLMALDDAVWPVIAECIEESAKQTISTEVSVDAIKTLQIMFNAFDSISTTFDETNFSKAFFERVKTSNGFEEERQQQKGIDDDLHEEATVKKKIFESAQDFVERMRKSLSDWLLVDSPVDLDKQFQQFAANFVLSEPSPNEAQILNCDAAYVSLYSALSLSLSTKQVTRREFLASSTCDGCYASDGWFSSVYRILQSQPLFDGKEVEGKSVLESVIEDYDGRNHKLLIYQALKSETAADEGTPPVIIEEREIKSDEMKQIDIWMRRLLSNCWGTIEIILGRFPLKADKKATEKFSVEGAEATLEAMKSFSQILRHFSMEREVLWLYEKFGEEVCNLEDLREFLSASKVEKKSWSMNRVDALGLYLIFENALISGTLSPNCWKYVVRAVEYVAELERHQFNLTKSANTSYNETSADGLADLLGKPSQKELTLKTIGKVLDELMLKIHAFFENAARQLNLPSFCSLLDLLIAANENNLKYSDNGRIPESCSLLQRICKLVVASSSRPLIHLMKIWGTVFGHFGEAASLRFPKEVTHLSIVSLGDIVRAFLRDETPGFCFNQTLFGVFQQMLCSDSCGAETQEHIVTILCTFIQEKPHHIGSGWKMIFGSIKAIRIASVKEKKKSKTSLNMIHFAVLEVMKKYFEINDPKIFVSTALEFIFCINHYLQSTVEETPEMEASQDEGREAQIAETILGFVEICKKLLVEYFDSDELPVFQLLLNRLKLREQNIDCVEDNYEGVDLEPLSAILREEDKLGVYPADLNEIIKKEIEGFPWASFRPTQQAITELILTLIESLSGLVLTCNRQIHSRLISGLADFISSFQNNSIGPDIGAFALSSLIFPIFQKGVRREKAAGFQLSVEASTTIKSLRQASGVLTALVVEYITTRPSALWSERLLLDSMQLLNEYIAHSSQAITGIGTACLKHLVESLAEVMSEELWKITTYSLWKTTTITLFPLRRITYHYFSESADIKGDIGEVSVGVRQEDANRDHVELQIMARQVFTIDDSAVTLVPLQKQGTLDVDSVPHTPLSPSPSTNIATRQLPYVFKLSKKGRLRSHELISNLILGQQSAILTNGTLSNQAHTSKSPEFTGYIHKAPSKAIGTLLHCLEATSTVASLFDDRPAVKTLFQKLCALEQLSNLYKYSIASESVKLLSIYEMARREDASQEHARILERSLKSLMEALKKVDNEAAANKLASFARDRLDQKIKISLVENNEESTDEMKTFTIVSAAKCLEDYKKQKRVDSLPARSRANPFFGRMDSTPRIPGTPGILNQPQLSQLGDLDLKILAYSEIIVLCIERFVTDDDASFTRLLPAMTPLVTDFLRVATNLRARNCIADFLIRVSKEVSHITE